MIRSIVSRVMWVGRATIFMVGLAVVLSLTLAIVAQAADARVPSLKKGVVNTVKSMSTLVGSLTTPILKLDNNGAGTALQLEVQPGNAPLVANADAGTATNLSADKLDGKEPGQLPGSIASVAAFHEFPSIPFDLGNNAAGWKFVGTLRPASRPRPPRGSSVRPRCHWATPLLLLSTTTSATGRAAAVR
jgi:hypothetical protein